MENLRTDEEALDYFSGYASRKVFDKRFDISICLLWFKNLHPYIFIEQTYWTLL